MQLDKNNYKSFFLCVFFMPLFTVLSACNSGSGGSSGGGSGEQNTPGGGAPPKGFYINLNGGSSLLSAEKSGNGGSVRITKVGGSGPLAVLNAGEVDASFTFPADTPDLGSVPLVIDTDTGLVLDPVVEPGVGKPYIKSSQPEIYVSNGDANFDNDPIATGLRVNENVVFSLFPNRSGIAPYPGLIEFSFSHDVQNLGTIKSAVTDALDIRFSANSYFGGAGSHFLLRSEAAGIPGGRMYMTLAGKMINHGTFDSSGFSDTSGDGTNAGGIFIDAESGIVNDGELFAMGGDSGLAQGGNGATISLSAITGNLYNSASIFTNGGQGHSGGHGGQVDFHVSTEAAVTGLSGVGDLTNSGNIFTSGGDALDVNGTVLQPYGGTGGHIALEVAGGNLRNSGNLTANGGDANAINATMAGGAGEIFLFSYLGFTPGTPVAFYSGDMLVSGNLEAIGGSATGNSTATALSGRLVEIMLDHSGQIIMDPQYRPTDSQSLTGQLSLLGYDTIDTNGGDGKQPGDGGNVDISISAMLWDGVSGFVDDLSGPLTNEAHISATGGNINSETLTQFSGSGGYVTFNGDPDPTLTNPELEVIINRGNLDVSGGSVVNSSTGDEVGGWGGSLDFFHYGNVVQKSDVAMSGGDGIYEGGQAGSVYIASIFGQAQASGHYVMDGGNGNQLGGSGGLFQVDSPESAGKFISVDIVVTSNGGDGAMQAGNGGGLILLDDDQIIASGDVSLHGGNANPAVMGSKGGNAGIVSYAAPNVDSANMIVHSSGGVGDIPGTN